jgi:protein-tyrosine phosphatase
LSDTEAASLSVLLVCTANHCRSPMAEFLMRAQLSVRDLDWNVSSAGTRAQQGVPIHPTAERILAKRGLVTGDWSSRALTAQQVEDADLILTAAEEHRGVVAKLNPTAMSRTFTLLQFAHLVSAMPMPAAVKPRDYGRVLLTGVAELRGFVQPMPRAERDLPDPMGQSSFRFRRCAAAIDRALDQILVGVPPLRWSGEDGPRPERIPGESRSG